MFNPNKLFLIFGLKYFNLSKFKLMSKPTKFICVSDSQTHSDKKRAQFVLSSDEEIKSIHSLALTYFSKQSDESLYSVKGEYEFILPEQNHKEANEEITEEKAEE